MTPDGKPLTWKPYVAQTERVNLREAIGQGQNVALDPDLIGVVGYAYYECLSSEAQQVELLLETADAIKVWMNGELVYRDP